MKQKRFKLLTILNKSSKNKDNSISLVETTKKNKKINCENQILSNNKKNINVQLFEWSRSNKTHAIDDTNNKLSKSNFYKAIDNNQQTVMILQNDVPKIYSNPNANISDLCEKLNIKPNNINLYKEALTHGSYSNEHNIQKNYQRLEFLGDAVINKEVANFLFHNSDNDEGKMTEDRKSIVQSKTLVRASCDLQLGEYLRLGDGLVNSPISERILEDIFESFIGAVFLDQDESMVKMFLKKTIFKYYLNNDLRNTIDWKTKFQEAVQEHGKNNNIVYKCVEKKKNPNDYFKVELIYNGMVYGRGCGMKLHDAEVAAAKRAFEKMIKINLSKPKK